MTGVEFDARVLADPTYPASIYAQLLRILVIRPYTDLINRNLADLVLFCSHGLVAVEKGKTGEPGITYPIDRCYLSQIFHTL